MIERPLGRREPSNWVHTARYPLTAATVPTTPVPVVLGVLWYSNFDRPTVGGDGRWWIGRGDLGRIRGGHAVCLKPQSLTDPTGWRTYYDQGTEGACFPAGSLVRMGDGSFTSIEKLSLFQSVQTAEGRTGFIEALSGRWHSGEIVGVRLRGHDGIRCTAEHPILTQRGYVRADELVIGDAVALPRLSLPNGIETAIEVSSLVSKADIGRAKVGASFGGVATVVATLPERIMLTEGLGRLFGLYLAEGGTTPNRVQWTFGGHERETLVAETVQLLDKELGVSGHVQVRPNGVCNVVVYGKGWRLLFERLFGSGVAVKSVPSVLAAAHDDVRRELLAGWLAGDGYSRRRETTGVSVSESLARSMWAIANDLGMFPAIRRSDPEGKRSRWDVTYGIGSTPHADADETTVWRKVSHLTREAFTGFVYNLTVRGDNSYVVNGIGVHNCVGFAASRAMSLLNRKRYDARWLYREAQRVDEWEGEAYSGTSVRAAMDVLRRVGHAPTHRGVTRPVDAAEGIVENRWAQSVDEVLACLQSPAYARLGAVPILNSWGTSFPHIVWLPLETLDRLLREDGEATMFVDRVAS